MWGPQRSTADERSLTLHSGELCGAVVHFALEERRLLAGEQQRLQKDFTAGSHMFSTCLRSLCNFCAAPRILASPAAFSRCKAACNSRVRGEVSLRSAVGVTRGKQQHPGR